MRRSRARGNGSNGHAAEFDPAAGRSRRRSALAASAPHFGPDDWIVLCVRLADAGTVVAGSRFGCRAVGLHPRSHANSFFRMWNGTCIALRPAANSDCSSDATRPIAGDGDGSGAKETDDSCGPKATEAIGHHQSLIRTVAVEPYIN